MPEITVVLCAHNPRAAVLREVLASLAAQTLDPSRWDLLLVDNGSTPPLVRSFADDLPPNARVVREEALGLARARIRGHAEADSPLIAFVDDDNILAPDYLEHAVALMAAEPHLGAVGGPVEGRFQEPPAPWMREWLIYLACRDHGPRELRLRWRPGMRAYPPQAPIGAGMVLRARLMDLYAREAGASPFRIALDRCGASLNSSGDVDLGLAILRQGWTAGYSPRLRLVHDIGRERLEPAYMARLVHAAVLSSHLLYRELGLPAPRRLPRAAAPLAKAAAWICHRAWSSPGARLRWALSCALVDARSTRPGALAADPQDAPRLHATPEPAPVPR